MSLAVDVVKHGGYRPTESYNPSKLHASIVAACLSTRTPTSVADAIADYVCGAVAQWLTRRPEVTSTDLRIVAGKHLRHRHPDAAYYYEQHRMIL
jgi:hypothetical protein